MNDMSRKEAIEVLKDIVSKPMLYSNFIMGACRVALASLETDEAYQLEYENLELCEDCISRKEVDRLANKYLKEPTDNHVAFYEQFLDLSSVLPKAKTGHWIYIGQSYLGNLKICECSNCKKRTYGSHDYCPNCGADMREVEE